MHITRNMNSEGHGIQLTEAVLEKILVLKLYVVTKLINLTIMDDKNCSNQPRSIQGITGEEKAEMTWTRTIQ